MAKAIDFSMLFIFYIINVDLDILWAILYDCHIRVPCSAFFDKFNVKRFVWETDI